MAHPRETIRKKAVELLLGKTSAGFRVYASRVAPFISNEWQNDLPAVVVYTMDESAEIYNVAPREYRRTVELVIEVHANATSAMDDVLDAIARQIEQTLLADDTLGGTANDVQLSRTRMVIRDEGQELLGGCRIILDVEYFDRHPDDFFNQSLPDLNTVATDYSLANAQPDPADRAQTIIEGFNK